jgi:hypothetical protein
MDSVLSRGNVVLVLKSAATLSASLFLGGTAYITSVEARAR